MDKSVRKINGSTCIHQCQQIKMTNNMFVLLDKAKEGTARIETDRGKQEDRDDLCELTAVVCINIKASSDSRSVVKSRVSAPWRHLYIMFNRLFESFESITECRSNMCFFFLLILKQSSSN